MLRRQALNALLILVLANLAKADSNPPLLLRHPTVSATQIVFVYGGDLWSVPRQGGAAQRLTAGNGAASRPVFSPDGSEIAFTGAYEGNADVYVIPASGGTPQRLTYHPAPDQVIGWTRDGKQVLFSSPRSSYSRFSQLFTISRQGGFPTELPLPIAAEGSYSPDGTELAYVPLDHAFEIWKRYRGGRTSPVWIAKLSDSSITPIPRDNSNDFNPMWIGDRVFFLSDRNGPVSLLSYDTKSKSTTIALKNDGLDFKYACAGPDAIVIEQFGAIWLYDLKTGTAHKVDVRISSDLPQLRPRFENVANRIVNADISPTGARAVFEARGEILTVPAEKGDIRNLTNSPSDERFPAWSPDGIRIAYFADESGEWALHIKNQGGQGEAQKIDLGTPPSFFYFPTWSPDSKKIAYTDKRLNLWYFDLEKKKPVRVFRDRFTGPQQIFRAAWSPDSRWLVYTAQEVSHMRSVFLYSLESGESHRVTDGLSDSFSPVFDRSGKYLYLLSSTDAGPTLDTSMLSFNRPVTSSVYIVVLRKDLPSPLAPESDDEAGPKPDAANAAPEKADSAKPEGAKADDQQKAKAKPPEPTKIDFERIGQRILALPIPAKNYTTVIPGKDGVLFLLEGPLVDPLNGPTMLTAHRFELKTRKTDKLVENVLFFQVSANGEKLLYRQPGPQAPAGGTPPPQTWIIATVPPAPTSESATPSGGGGIAGAKALNLNAMDVRIEPTADWKELYHEAFRTERDFFYDPGFRPRSRRCREEVRGVPPRPGFARRLELCLHRSHGRPHRGPSLCLRRRRPGSEASSRWLAGRGLQDRKWPISLLTSL
jgi:tricorn protease